MPAPTVVARRPTGAAIAADGPGWRSRRDPGPTRSLWGTTGAGAVGTHNVPRSVRALSSVPDVDYVDHFTVVGDGDATPEQWARAMFGDVPSIAERLIWSGLLQLRLSPGRSPATVAGWRIGGRGPDWIRLEAASWFLTANLIVRTADGRVSLTTVGRYDRRLGRRVWPPLSAVHRRLVPEVLRGAAARIRTVR